MLHLKGVARKNPQDDTAASKYYAYAITTGMVDFERLAYLVSNQCTVRVSDCLAVLRALEHNMMDELEQGRTVQFGDLGLFHIGVSSEGKTTPEEVNSATVKGARMNFRPAKRLRKMLKGLEYKMSNE
ncbi:MAG: DNA-binding protein [Lutibacter sp.]|uniref:HU family DNA-binding protein n=1 Tax=Lutibacter sp. TaxID=1925666 RepID=UPI00385CFF7C